MPNDDTGLNHYSITCFLSRKLIMIPTANATKHAPEIIRAIVRDEPPFAATLMIKGTISSETRLTTLIIGLRAGPAVSLSGSPTVSPMTLALCRSEPLPRLFSGSEGSASICFLALSQAPPALAIKTANSCPVTMMPARKPPSARTPIKNPIIIPQLI